VEAEARSAPPPAADDAAIRDRVLAEIDRQPWAPRALVNVAVQNGIVELWGAVTGESQRQALKILAESIPGAKGVQDNLVWVEPTSGLAVTVSDEEAQRMKAVGR